MLFSIIVPVYNSEKYLENTIQSVLRQSLTDWQLLLVDDGSTDGSSDICRRRRLQDGRIVVISQENGGPSAARNTGIKAADGEYIMFLDSDDEYRPGAFRAVKDCIDTTGADLIMSSSEIFDADSGRTVTAADYILKTPIKSTEDFFCQLREKRVSPGPCRYAVKTGIIKNNSLFFPVGITLAEDCMWLNNMLGFISGAVYNEKPFYKYNIHSGSITTTMNFSKANDLMKVCDGLFLLAEKRPGELGRLHLNYCCILSNSLLQNYSGLSAQNKKIVRLWVKERRRSFDAALKMQPFIKMLSVFTGNFYAMLFFAQAVKMKNRILKKL